MCSPSISEIRPLHEHGTARHVDVINIFKSYEIKVSVWASQGGYCVPRFGNSTTFSENRYGGYTAPVRRTPLPYPPHRTPAPKPYPRTVPPYRTPIPYPHTLPPYRTHTKVRTHRTYPLCVPVPTPKLYPILGPPTPDRAQPLRINNVDEFPKQFSPTKE